jgi:hypothetical protein
MSSNKILFTSILIFGLCIIYILSLGPITAMISRNWINSSWINLYTPLFSIQAYFTTNDYLGNYAMWFAKITGSNPWAFLPH